MALLDRFTINVSPSGQDEQEKEEVLSWIVQMGEKAVSPLVQFLKRERQVYWAVRALRETVNEEEFAEKINGVLQDHWENPPASSDPTAQLIRLLGVRSPQLMDTVALLFGGMKRTMFAWRPWIIFSIGLKTGRASWLWSAIWIPRIGPGCAITFLSVLPRRVGV